MPAPPARTAGFSVVEIALRRPYTFIVMAMLILLATPLVLKKMATDIFPEIDIPVISMIWNYKGLPAEEMGLRIAGSTERSLTTTVSDIEHIESTSLPGTTVIKIFFQPKANIQTAIAQVVAIAQTQVRQLPPGTTPPLIIQYSASSIPVIQLALSSPTLPEQGVFDAAVNQLRPQLVTIPGVAIPWPYGGKVRLISVDLNLQQLQARGLSPADVVNALSAQNLVLPSGTAKFGGIEYNVTVDASPDTIAALGDLPVRTANGATVYLRDVAEVRDGFQPQTNIVRRDGERGVLLSVLKNGGASTLDVVNNLRALLPFASQQLPENVKVTPLFDQSVFVKAAVTSVAIEAIIAAALTALMVLLFLGNWRSTLIIALTIPLSILASVIALYMLGETLNIMTLGGLALSVGILVDQAIVTIENIERHLHAGAELNDAILAGANEIGVPAFVSTVCICIVFVPMFFLEGVARYLFVPMAEAVVFAMIVSYILSRTLVPTMMMLMMKGHAGTAASTSLFGRVSQAFDRRFERVRSAYSTVLSAALERRGAFATAFLGACLLSCLLYPFLGRDFFPAVDAGQIKLHFRAPTGTRIEETAQIAERIDAAIRELIPADELATILDNLGVPNSSINLSYSTSGTIGTLDGEILMGLKHGHRPTSEFVTLLRRELPKRFPGVEFFFQPADIVTQILNFGLPAAIDVQFSGKDVYASAALASELTRKIRAIPGAVDAHVHQRLDSPSMDLRMDRTRMQEMGLSAANVGQNVLLALAGSGQTAPAYWLNPTNGIVYNIAVQAPDYRIDSLDSLLNIPVAGESATRSSQILANVVDSRPTRSQAVVSRYDLLPTIDIYVGVQGTDLASVASEVERLVEEVRPRLPRGSKVVVRGQVETMQKSFIGLGVGLLMAIVLVYLLIVVDSRPTRSQAVVSRYDLLPTIDIYVGVQGTDLASVASEVERLVEEVRPRLPRGSKVVVRGQVETMQKSFIGLGVGLLMAIVLVYLLIVVNFQSWIDAFIVIAALPAALAGIAWMLFITGTTLSVPALTGAIMTMGVATANSILLISFARDRQAAGVDALRAALEAGATRIRPVMMTALAMIIGMIPMALGVGEGGEQNAPLGRAVIGGLVFATLSTLLFVPVVFASVHTWLARRHPRAAVELKGAE